MDHSVLCQKVAEGSLVYIRLTGEGRGLYIEFLYILHTFPDTL